MNWYERKFKYEIYEGYGEYFYINSDKYVGKLKHDLMNRIGTIYYQSGDIYKENFKIIYEQKWNFEKNGKKIQQFVKNGILIRRIVFLNKILKNKL